MPISSFVGAGATLAKPPFPVEAQRARLSFCFFATAIIAAACFGFATSFLQDPDTWWHIRVGQDILSTRTLPTVDTYSHTFVGHPWIAKEWLGQLFFALAYMAGGWNGVALLTIAAIALTTFLFSWHASTALRPTAAIGLTFIVAALIAPILTSRPHIFTLPIVVIWSASIFRAARNEQAPPWWLLPLLCLWANLHATFTFGYIIAAFASLDLVSRIHLSNPRLVARWIIFGLLCIPASLFNPYGVKAILATFTVAYGNEAVSYIMEWRPFQASRDRFQEAILLLCAFGLLVSPLRIGWAKALFILFTLHIYLVHARFIYMFFLLIPLVISREIAEQYPSLSIKTWTVEQRDGIERFFAKHLYPLTGVIGVSLICAAAIFVTAYPIEPSPKTSAKEALAFAERSRISGNVLNSYDFGGALIFHGIKTFVDGRTDQLFLNDFTKTSEATMITSGKRTLEAQLNKHAIEWALLTEDDPRIPFFDDLTNWNRVYADEYAVIYTRVN